MQLIISMENSSIKISFSIILNCNLVKKQDDKILSSWHRSLREICHDHVIKFDIERQTKKETRYKKLNYLAPTVKQAHDLDLDLTLAVPMDAMAMKERCWMMWFMDSAISMLRRWKVCSMAWRKWRKMSIRNANVKIAWILISSSIHILFSFIVYVAQKSGTNPIAGTSWCFIYIYIYKNQCNQNYINLHKHQNISCHSFVGKCCYELLVILFGP